MERLHDQLMTSSAAAFSLSLETLGFWQKAGIFWLGPKQYPADLLDLVKSLRTAAHQADISIEKRDYVPHLTLARRCVELPSAPLIEPQFRFSINHFTLFESVRLQAKVVYRPVFELPLGG